MRFPVKKTSFSRHGGKLKLSTLQPVLPLLPEVLPTKDQDKSKFINFELMFHASQPAGSTTDKKFVRVFEGGSPQQWIDLIYDLEEIWTQNSVNGPSNQTSTIRALLKGASLTAFETALEDVRVDPDPNVNTLQALTIKHIGGAMDQTSNAVFPHCALEIQKLWTIQGMKKPYDLSACKTAAAIAEINNCLPVFPLGLPASKFTDQEVVGLLEWSLPLTCRKKFDLDGHIPTLLERRPSSSLNARPSNKTKASKRERGRTTTTTTTISKKNKFGNSVARAQKMNAAVKASSMARTAAITAHMLRLSVIF
jgi:hypothetical protein